MPRTTRLRWTDWFGLLGLALLLAWTPAYVGQDPIERTLTGGEMFTLPMPRVGDRAVLDLVVTYGDGTTAAFPALVEVSIDGAGPGTPAGVPDGVVAAHTVHHRAAAFSVGPVRYESYETLDRTWYGADGGVVWLEHHGSDSYNDDVPAGSFPPPERGRTPLACERIGALNAFPAGRLRYEPGPERLKIAELADTVVRLLTTRSEPDCMFPSRPGGGFVNEAAQVGDHLLLGWNTFAASGDTSAPDPNNPPAACRLDERLVPGGYWAPFRTAHDVARTALPDRLRVPAGIDMRCEREHWLWFTPSFPTPVGFHARYEHPDGGLLLQLDLVPSRIEIGSGPPVPVTIRPTEGWSMETPLHSAREPETMPLGQLPTDQTPLVGGHSAAFIDAQLRANAPDSLRDFLPDARLVAIEGEVQESADRPQEDERRSRWRLVYGNDEGHLRPASMRLEHLLVPGTAPLPGPLIGTPSGPHSAVTNVTRTWTATVEDVCTSADPDTRAFHCASVEPAVIAPERPLASLAELMREANQISGGQYGTVSEPAPGVSTAISYQPIAGFRLDRENETKTPTDEGVFKWQLSHEPAGDDVGFYQAGEHELAHGLRTLHVKEHRTWGEPDANQRQPPELAATEARAVPVTLTPIGQGLAFSGLVLLLAAAYLRIVAALKSGALPAFAAGLYAKVRSEDVLLHERREAIVDALRAEPGLTAKELSVRLGAGWGATVHHLETLRRNGLVTRIAIGRNRHHFLADGSTLETRRLLALRREPAYAAFLDAVAAQPGRTLQELADVLAQGASGVSRTGSRLQREGLIDKRRDRFSVRFYPAGSPERRK